MKTVFFTQDSDLTPLGENYEMHFTESSEQVSELVGAGPAVLVLDFDLDKKASENLCKEFSDNELVHCIVVGKSFSAKELKKLQAKEDAASGYFGKPLERSVFDEIVEDFELIAGSSEEVDDEDVEFDDTSPTQVTEEEEALPQAEEIPAELESADGEAISFDEADDGLTFDMGEEGSDDEATDPSRTDVNLEEESTEFDDEMEFDVTAEEESVEAAADESVDEMEFDVSGEEEDVEVSADEEDVEVEFDAGAEEDAIATENTEEVGFDAAEEGDDDDVELELGDDQSDEGAAPSDGIDITLGGGDEFGELELSNKSEAKTESNESEEDETGELDMGDGENMSLEADQEEATGEFDTAATELNPSSAPNEVGTSDYTRPSEEVSSGEEVKLLSDEDKAAIARVEKIDYTYDENEMVKAQVTIRHMREERASLLKEIDLLKSAEKQKDQGLLSLRAELDEAKIEISILKKRRNEDIENIKYQLRLSEEKKKIYEEKLKHYQGEFSKLDKKVRVDINQVRQKEKELESKLELTVMDAESQIKSRDTKIAELKRKIDSLEFNMENVSINEQKLKEDKIRLEERIAKIMSTLRNSISVIEDDLDFDDEALLERLNKL